MYTSTCFVVFVAMITPWALCKGLILSNFLVLRWGRYGSWTHPLWFHSYFWAVNTRQCNLWLPTTRRHVRRFVGLLVCRQDYTKSTDRISTKLGGRTGLSTEKIPFCVNPGVFVLFFFNNARQDLVLHCWLISQGVMHRPWWKTSAMLSRLVSMSEYNLEEKLKGLLQGSLRFFKDKEPNSRKCTVSISHSQPLLLTVLYFCRIWLTHVSNRTKTIT